MARTHKDKRNALVKQGKAEYKPVSRIGVYKRVRKHNQPKGLENLPAVPGGFFHSIKNTCRDILPWNWGKGKHRKV